MMYKLLLVACLVSFISCDLYMQNPPGSNNRNRERNQQRANANRLFDSQNNAQGGYPWRGDGAAEHILADVYANQGIRYLAGSWLNVEWTNQHGCGPNSNLACQMILQYSCDWKDDNYWYGLPGARTGYPSGGIDSSDQQANTQLQNGKAGYLRRVFESEDQNQQGTNSIPDFYRGNQDRDQRLAGETDEIKQAFYYKGEDLGLEFGLHESPEYHGHCYRAERNKGLFIADRGVNEGRGATVTRQNNNGYDGNSGNRNGFECPEERDYYPYWRPSPWIDIAVLTNEIEHCEEYVQQSFNKVAKNICECDTEDCQDGSGTPQLEKPCKEQGGTWKQVPSHYDHHQQNEDIDFPECQPHPWNRDNHLGASTPVNRDNTPQLFESGEPDMATYKWQIPEITAGHQCVLRMRYNISTGESHHALTSEDNCKSGIVRDVKAAEAAEDGDDEKVKLIKNRVSSPHCNAEISDAGEMPWGINRPYFDMYEGQPRVSVAYKTNQAARTFQDRSYVFASMSAEGAGIDPMSETVVNLNGRGRRGNIVQTYPALEYDFVPLRLVMDEGDYVHIQFFGSDFDETENANNGEGWRYSTRFNMYQTTEGSNNYPMVWDEIEPEKNLFPTKEMAKRMMMVDQNPDECLDTYNGNNNNDNNDDQQAPENCGKLNRASAIFPSWEKRFDTLLQMNEPGTYYYASTRNNNFSNRSQKASITVEADNALVIILGSVGAVVAVAGIAFAGVLIAGKRNPSSSCGRLVNK